MGSILTALSFLVLAGASCSAACLEKPLQDDVRFNQLSGTWWQAYYRMDSKFVDYLSYEFKIFEVNMDRKEFQGETQYVKVSYAKQRPVKRIIYSTVNWEDEPSVKDRVVTDYENYFILFKCREGTATVEDVLLRKEVTRLPLDKVKEVAEALKRVGVDFYSFEERRQQHSPATFE